MKHRVTDIIDLLVESAYWIIDQKVKMAHGMPVDDGVENWDKAVQSEILKMIEPQLSRAHQTRQLEAQNVAGVMKLLTNGKIDIQEAISLMEIFKAKSDVEDLPRLIEALEKHGK